MNTGILPNGDELMLLPEVAAVLRGSVKTVRRLITEGQLIACKVRGRVMVLKSDLMAYIDKITKK